MGLAILQNDMGKVKGSTDAFLNIQIIDETHVD